MQLFEIERYGTEDGPGIRTVVFFKGCNLWCSWCQNPESQVHKPQVMYYPEQCVACRRCVEACPTGSVRLVEPFGFITEHETCILCGACVDACYYNARKIVGEAYSVEEVMKEIRKDKSFYVDSGGGVTFSGGEPLLQPLELIELAKACQAEKIHTALETAGNVDWPVFERVLPCIDLLYFDMKHIDPIEHKKHTGVSNERILENICLAADFMENIVVRIALIPGINTTMDVQHAMYSFLLQSTRVRRVELLPFHRLGAGKYVGLGRVYRMADTQNLTKADCELFAKAGQRMGLSITVGAK